MSLGSRSGVNCTRLTVQSTARPNALASMVFPTPGTSSINKCPSASRTVSVIRMTSGFPVITVSIADRTRWAGARRPLTPTGLSAGPPTQVSSDTCPPRHVVTVQHEARAKAEVCKQERGGDTPWRGAVSAARGRETTRARTVPPPSSTPYHLRFCRVSPGLEGGLLLTVEESGVQWSQVEESVVAVTRE